MTYQDRVPPGLSALYPLRALRRPGAARPRINPVTIVGGGLSGVAVAL